jgi:hypothetical protein
VSERWLAWTPISGGPSKSAHTPTTFCDTNSAGREAAAPQPAGAAGPDRRRNPHLEGDDVLQGEPDVPTHDHGDLVRVTETRAHLGFA